MTPTSRRVRPAALSRYRHSEVVIFEDSKMTASRLKQELVRRGIVVQLSSTLQGLITTAKNLSNAVFAIDINMGKNRSTEGIDAIRALRKVANDKEAYFSLIALTSHGEYEGESFGAGADGFILKSSAPTTDALKIIDRFYEHSTEVENDLASGPRRELAKREYKDLCRNLQKVRQNPSVHLKRSLSTVRNALNWSFLSRNEKLILSSLGEQLRQANQSGEIDPDILALCLKGARMLAKDRASGAPASDWIVRAREASPDFLFSWLQEHDLENDDEDNQPKND